MDYQTFLDSKTQLPGGDGFSPVFMPDFLFDFQKSLADWAISRGRGAIFADCGLGKTPMQLVWAQNIVQHTNEPVLIITPLSVGRQTVREGAKFGIDCQRSQDGKIPSGAKIVVTNYERLDKFNPADFAGVVCDESSILKNFDGVTKAAITEFMRTRRYRLLCTATAAPNDYDELGTSAEAVGEMGYQDMVTKFYRKLTSKDHLGWGRTKYKLRGHAERDFWRWVCSWARACRKPSDLGFDDGRFILPPLITREHVVKASRPASGKLFDVPAETLEEQREEQRRTLPERCCMVADLCAKHEGQSIAWCHLNDEGDLLENIIPDCVQVSGKDEDEAKEEKLDAFISGKVRVLVSKPKLAGFGLNLQNCDHQTFFPSHSFESFYQAVRRSWRFGQDKQVVIDLITTDGSAGVLANLQRKAAAADAMFANLVSLMNESLRIGRGSYGEAVEKLPAWLKNGVKKNGRH